MLKEIAVPQSLSFMIPLACDDMVRVGNKNDGGYVIPKRVLNEIDALISLGLSNDWSFDAAFLALNPNIKIHAYDHTVSKQYFKKRMRMTFVKWLLGSVKFKEVLAWSRVVSSYDAFFKGNSVHYQERVHNRKDNDNDATMAIIFERIHSDRVFLKMDIEGSEYRVIDDLLQYASKITFMVIEFHDTDPLREVFKMAVQKIKKYYEIVHIHGNNFVSPAADGLPEVMEIAFMRKDFCGQEALRLDVYLEGLDTPCDPSKADYRLVFK